MNYNLGGVDDIILQEKLMQPLILMSYLFTFRNAATTLMFLRASKFHYFVMIIYFSKYRYDAYVAK